MSKDNHHPAKNKMGRPEYWTVARVATLETSLWKHANDQKSYDILGWRGKEKLTRGMVFWCRIRRESRCAAIVSRDSVSRCSIRGFSLAHPSPGGPGEGRD